MESTIPRVPTTVFTGFLGAGKTTIIANLIDQLQTTGVKVVYIKNEIGNENVDAKIFKGKHIQTKELLNGCICCTLVGPFIQAIDEIIETLKPDRILIEASGAADPAALALMIDSHPKIKRDGVLAIIDVVNFDGYIDLSLTAQNQTKFTDLIVFNKVELVNLARKQAVVGYVRELNTHSPIVEAPAGKLEASIAFGLASLELDQLLANTGFNHESVGQQQHPHQHHLIQDGIESFSAPIPQGVAEQALRQFLEQLPAAVYRVKGIFRPNPSAVFLINKVGQRIEIEPVAEQSLPSTDTILVLTGFRILQFQAEITNKLALLAQNLPS
ncbi:MAG: hypothetical protein COY81_04815 [Candidatus Pacebacteria bacterium CG_4_10_14_0_8_um_filter_43_12]|nr:MAG: hypothetical protein COY81_04815 [Candidatus Pacebacteria bacterium CG_4_10_14_0_8_um_filter_43_12]